MRAPVVCLLFVCANGSASAQHVPGQNYQVTDLQAEWRATPSVGSIEQVTTGSTMIERHRVWSLVATRVTGARSYSLGTFLGPRLWDDKDLVARDNADGVAGCGVGYPELYCAVDTNRDGGFDTAVFYEDGMAKPPRRIVMKRQIPYSPPARKQVPAPDGEYRQELIYLGVAGNTLRLAYREFVNDMARPAFSTELTFTLSGKGPEEIAYKDILIEVQGVSNAGIRYVIKKAGGTP